MRSAAAEGPPQRSAYATSDAAGPSNTGAAPAEAEEYTPAAVEKKNLALSQVAAAKMGSAPGPDT